MNDLKRLLSFLSIALSLLLLSSCGARVPAVTTETAFVLNTVASVTLYGDYSSSSAISDAFALCTSLENTLSRTVPGSDIARLNAGEHCPVSSHTSRLLSLGLEVCALSGGALDLTMGRVTELWDFSAEVPSVPDPFAIDAALKTVDYRSVTVSGNEVSFSLPGTKLELGAVAKGYIADRMKEQLLSAGASSGFLDLGGNILCLGPKPDGSPITVGIRRPFGDDCIAVVETTETLCSVVTSGVYERCFTADGTFYHHILDPKTGYPTDNGLYSVTIISESSALGDALSTACFVMGLEQGMELIDRLDNVYAIFIDENNQLHYSEGLTDALNITT